MTLKNKYKVSAYLTDSEVELLDSLATQWECSKSQAIIRAIRVLTNSDNNPNPISNPIPSHSVNIGLSKEEVELLIEERVELLVNSRIELLERQETDTAKKFETLEDAIAKLQSEIDALKTSVVENAPFPDYSPIFIDLPFPIPSDAELEEEERERFKEIVENNEVLRKLRESETLESEIDYSPIFTIPDPSPTKGLQGQELAALITSQGVNCRSEYLSLYRKGRHIPPKLKEILDRDWVAKGKYWYPKDSTP